MNAQHTRRQWLVVFSAALFVLLSCKQIRSEPNSNVNGIVSSHAVIVKPRLADDLAKIAVNIGQSIQKIHVSSSIKTESQKDIKEQLRAIYLQTLLDSGGLPRAQGVAIFRVILAPDQNLCAGVPCSHILGMAQEDVEPFFDGLAKIVDSSPLLKGKSKEYERNILRLSLARPTPTELIGNTSKSERLSVPKAVSRPDADILSRERLFSELKPETFRAIKGYTEDDFKDLRFIEAHTDKELMRRGYGKSYIDSMRSQINEIRVAFSNAGIPRVKTPVYRGMHEVSAVDLSHYIYHSQTGEPIGLGPEHRGAMTSASWDPNVADQFLGHSRFTMKYNVIFEIKNHGGISIENISIAPFEREVLIPGDRKFTVSGVHLSKERSNLYIVHLDGYQN